MPISRLLLRSLLVLTASGSVASVAFAQSGNPPPQPPPPPPQRVEMAPHPDPMRSQNSASSLSDAVRRVQRETGGQVLGAERVQFDGRDINRVKVMDDRGRVRYMDDDPQRSRESSDRRRNGPGRDPFEQGGPARSDNPGRP